MNLKLAIVVFASASLSLLTASTLNARIDDVKIQQDTNPVLQIQTQIETINLQINLIQTSLLSIPRNAVTGPTIERDTAKSIAPIVEEFKILGDDVEQTLVSSLQEFEGQYKNVALPNSLSTDYLAQLPQPRGDQEFKCLAEALYFEARGETLVGQRAVAEVILNRVESSRYPDSICGVVNQGTGKKHRCQFSYTCDGIPEVVSEPKAFTRGAKIARLMIDGLYENKQITGGALFYHTTAVNPYWASAMTYTNQFGVHLFYRQ